MGEATNIINDVFFDFIYGESLDDATRRTGVSKETKDSIKKNKAIREAVKEYAQAVIDGKMPNFCECVEKIKMNLGDIYDFTFGNIQKLINMTIKRLYLKYSDICRENFFCCLAPMDMQMRDLVCRKHKQDTGKSLGIENCAWSKLSKKEGKDNIDNFFVYQSEILRIIQKENPSFLPVEYDYIMWGKSADEVLPDNNPFEKKEC